MCLTLPQTLITVMGIEKVIPSWADLGVFLQLLPRSSTGERMNPYTSLWTGVTPGDGPRRFHLVLLDNGRTAALADETGRQALHCNPLFRVPGTCARCTSAPAATPTARSIRARSVPCYRRSSPAWRDNASLPYASSLCGACYDACPVKIDIPSLLVHLRAGTSRRCAGIIGGPAPRRSTMAAAAWVMADPGRLRRGAAGREVRACAEPRRPDQRAAAAAVRLDPGPRRARPARPDVPAMVARVRPGTVRDRARGSAVPDPHRHRPPARPTGVRRPAGPGAGPGFRREARPGFRDGTAARSPPPDTGLGAVSDGRAPAGPARRALWPITVPRSGAPPDTRTPRRCGRRDADPSAGRAAWSCPPGSISPRCPRASRPCPTTA